MKTKIILSILGLLFTNLFCKKTFAQNSTTEEKVGVITKETTPAKKDKERQEIVIVKKGSKDTKVTLEITDGKIIINGKPLAEFKEDGLTINNRKIIIKDGNKITMDVNDDVIGKMQMMDDLDMSTVESITIDKLDGMDFNGFGEGSSTKTFLGVGTEKNDKGAKIISVEKGSPAEKAGLKTDDIIYKVNNTEIDGMTKLSEVISAMKVGEKVSVYFLRNGKKESVNATLGERKNNFSINEDYSLMYQMPNGKVRSLNMPKMQKLRKLQRYNMDGNFNFENNQDFGNLLIDMRKPKLGLKIQDTEEGNGVKVLEVEEESTSAKAGLVKDDIVTEIGGVKVTNTDEAREQLKVNKEKTTYTIKANRAGKEMEFTIKIPKKLKTAEL
jgi:serine protease Do